MLLGNELEFSHGIGISKWPSTLRVLFSQNPRTNLFCWDNPMGSIPLFSICHNLWTFSCNSSETAFVSLMEIKFDTTLVLTHCPWAEPLRHHPSTLRIANGSPGSHFLTSSGIRASLWSCPISKSTVSELLRDWNSMPFKWSNMCTSISTLFTGMLSTTYTPDNFIWLPSFDTTSNWTNLEFFETESERVLTLSFW